MDNLEKLERRITDKKVVEVDKVNQVDVSVELKKIYKLISNTNNRTENKLNYIEIKLDTIIKAIENANLTEDEIKKQEEIKKLEQQLKELRGES